MVMQIEAVIERRLTDCHVGVEDMVRTIVLAQVVERGARGSARTITQVRASI